MIELISIPRGGANLETRNSSSNCGFFALGTLVLPANEELVPSALNLEEREHDGGRRDGSLRSRRAFPSPRILSPVDSPGAVTDAGLRWKNRVADVFRTLLRARRATTAREPKRMTIIVHRVRHRAAPCGFRNRPEPAAARRHDASLRQTASASACAPAS